MGQIDVMLEASLDGFSCDIRTRVEIFVRSFCIHEFDGVKAYGFLVEPL
mgnify:CR=1 FL=1